MFSTLRCRERNAAPVDCCRISSLRLTMCCRPTRETLILGGGFETAAAPLLFPTDAQRFPRPLYCKHTDPGEKPSAELYPTVGSDLQRFT